MSLPPPLPAEYTSHAPHVDRYIENSSSVARLLALHGRVGGTGPGRRVGLEVLNKSAIVLMTACWEAFVEDLALAAFQLLLDHGLDHKVFPDSVLTLVANSLKEEKHDHAVWELAGLGWRTVLVKYRDAMVKKYIHSFSTPRARQVDDLCQDILGLESLSRHWHWTGISSTQAVARLNGIITLRGEIAHRVDSQRVRKSYVVSSLNFIDRLVIASQEAVARHVKALLGTQPWESYAYRAS